jgi:hypothetical protein
MTALTAVFYNLDYILYAEKYKTMTIGQFFITLGMFAGFYLIARLSIYIEEKTIK